MSGLNHKMSLMKRFKKTLLVEQPCKCITIDVLQILLFEVNSSLRNVAHFPIRMSFQCHSKESLFMNDFAQLWHFNFKNI